MYRIAAVALLSLIASLPLAAEGQVSINSVEDVQNMDVKSKDVSVSASLDTLAGITKALAERAPDIEKLHIFHGANSKLKLNSRPIQHLAGLRSLTSFTFTGDPTLALQDFKDIGALKNLTYLKLSLP
ncbi:MAG: hypothetical protein ACYTDT_02885 [Planctomycetota bacterium]